VNSFAAARRKYAGYPFGQMTWDTYVRERTVELAFEANASQISAAGALDRS